MSNLVLLAICLVSGIVLQRVKGMPKDPHVILNIIILHIPLPSLILISVPVLVWDKKLFSLVLVAWVIFGLSYGFFSFVGHKLGWEKKLIGCLILTAGLGNTAFVGFPVIESLYGAEALKYAILIDQPGTFLICSSLGLWLVTHFSQENLRKRELALRILAFPPFVAFTLSVLLIFLNMRPSGMTENILQHLASLLAPLALISVGLQLKAKEIQHDWKYLSWGLGFKLIIAPIFIFCIYSLLDIPRDIFEIVVMEAAMAPMITSAILAATYGLHPRLAGLMIGVGVPLSFLSLSAWYFLLR